MTIVAARIVLQLFMAHLIGASWEKDGGVRLHPVSVWDEILRNISQGKGREQDFCDRENVFSLTNLSRPSLATLTRRFWIARINSIFN
jgi:hypothetical protein